MQHYYAYILKSEKDVDFYTGYTKDLNTRLHEHSDGRLVSTKDRRPLKLVYWNACLSQQDATRREKNLEHCKEYSTTCWYQQTKSSTTHVSLLICYPSYYIDKNR
ncbi:MAG: GIY-YIG nuclease family protein [Bacteroidales bacterium]|nr:GIY-YIG nuclease family protein [Bacteroidales bacterium]MDD4385777.1 GIY-YIG nuclease family protein [Bacteroidales bacterium]MDD4385780.1 GIY-YIG nuclease family protein [Bacteroidales bacterium]